MSEPKLVPFSLDYLDRYLEKLQEYSAHNDGSMSLQDRASLSPEEVAQLVQKLSLEYLPEHVDPGLVACSHYFLANEHNALLGECRIRHELTERLLWCGGHIGYDIYPSHRGKGYGNLILKLALEKARELGIYWVMVTCDEDNVISRKVIEANGGVLDEKCPLGEDDGVKILRFWIQNN
jgi:predicted acetyltransferase